MHLNTSNSGVTDIHKECVEHNAMSLCEHVKCRKRNTCNKVCICPVFLHHLEALCHLEELGSQS